MNYDLSELLSLSTKEKLRIIDALWNSIDEAADPIELSSEVREEVRRRHAEMLADPDSALDQADIDRILDVDDG